MSLVAWYPLYKDLKDYSGNENDLINSSEANIVLDPTSGKLGTSYNFNGTGYLSSKNKIKYSQVTYTAWIYFTGSGSNMGIVNNFSHGKHNIGLCLTASGALRLDFKNKNINTPYFSTVRSSLIATENKWHHVAISVDTITGVVVFYLDGEADTAKQIDGVHLPITIMDETLLIGQWGWGYITEYYYLGKMNDVRVYDHILSKKEIRDIYKTCVLHYNFSAPMLIDRMIDDISMYDYRGRVMPVGSSLPIWENNSPIGSGSYRFNGSNYCIESEVPVLDEYTISVWFKMASLTGSSTKSPSTLLAISSNNANYPLWIRLQNGHLIITTFNSVYGVSTDVTIANIVRLDTWHNLTLTLTKGGLCKIYMDGEYIESYTAGNVGMLNSDKLYIGDLRVDRQLNMNGNIADVRMYANILIEEEIKQLYEATYSIDMNANVYSNDINEFDGIDFDNLFYNGDLHLKNNTNFPGMVYSPVDGGCLEAYGYIERQLSEFIPVNGDDVYELSFEVKSIDPNSLSNLYFGVVCYDNDRKMIPVTSININSNSMTTLAKELKNGDTTITLSSSVGWSWSAVLNRNYIGICDNIAWGYRRCRIYVDYTEINGNIITLTVPWSEGAIPNGTSVANFSSSGTYNYFDNRNYSSDWTSYAINSLPSGSICNNGFRFSTSYIKFLILSTNSGTNNIGGIRVRNMKIKNISNPQNVIIPVSKMTLNKKGIIPYEINEIGMNIRYIRDHLNGGNTTNAQNHWTQIKAYNNIDVNMAWGKKVTSDQAVTFGDIQVITDNQEVVNKYISISITAGYVEVDLGYVQPIDSLVIWHYWNDARTYHENRTEVSQDGINWITVFDSSIEGEYVETKEGHEIILYPERVYLDKNSKMAANSFIEP